PTMAIVFAEENPGSINDGYWIQDPTKPSTWIDSPAHYHNNSGSMSFADGHAESRKWTDGNVLADKFGGAGGFPATTTTNTDLTGVQQRCSVLVLRLSMLMIRAGCSMSPPVLSMSREKGSVLSIDKLVRRQIQKRKAVGHNY